MFTWQLKKCGNPSVPKNGVYGGGGYRKNRLNLMVLAPCYPQFPTVPIINEKPSLVIVRYFSN